MRRAAALALAAGLLAAIAAPAQTVIGPPPPAVPAQPPSPDTPASPDAGTAAPAPAPGNGPPLTPAPPPPGWEPRTAARLVLIEKVAAQPTPLAVPVGRDATFESLTVHVRACLVRPPGIPGDATAFLDITDSHPGAPDFHGWVFANEPSVSMLQHPVYDVLLTGCA